MLLAIFSFALTIGGIALIIVAEKNHWRSCDAIETVGIVLSAIGIGLLIVVGTFGLVHAINYDLDRQAALEARETIVYRLEQQADNELGQNLVVNGGVYQDALEFNRSVRLQKKWGTNPWINWFVGWEYLGLEEIEIQRNK